MVGMNQIIDIFKKANKIDFSMYGPEASEFELNQDDYNFLKSNFEYGPEKPKNPYPDISEMESSDLDYLPYNAGLTTPLDELIMIKEPRFINPHTMLIYYFFYLAKNSNGFVEESKILETTGHTLTDLGINKNDKLFYDIARTYWTLKALLHMIFVGDPLVDTYKSSDDIKFSNAVQLLVELDMNMSSFFFPTDATKIPDPEYISSSRMKELEKIKIPDSVRLNETQKFLQKIGMYSEEEIKLIIKQNPRLYSPESGCFIATAVYDSPYSYELKILRAWRDNYLLKTYFGNLFVRYYYRYSQYIVTLINKNQKLKSFVKSVLNLIVDKINKIY